MGGRDPITELVAELEAIQQRQLEDLLIHRHIFRQFADATQSYVGSQRSAVLSDWIAGNYVAFAVTAVRRIVDNRSDVHSLMRFLHKLKKDCSPVSRQRMRQKFIDALPPSATNIAIEKADELFDFGVGQSGLNVLTDAVIDADIAALKQASKQIAEAANCWIAHDSRSPTVSSLSYGELNSAIDMLELIYSRYYALIMARKPTFSPLDHYDCRDEFRRIWPETPR